MKNMLFRIAAAAAAMIVACSSCGGKGSSSEEATTKNPNELVGDAGDDVNISSDEMPYGATLFQMTEADYGVPATTEVDSRFFNEEEARLICNYFWAICSKDGDLFSSVSYPAYLDHILSDNNYGSAKEYMEDYYNEYYTVIGTDYEFSYIYAADCKNTDSGFNFEKYDQIIRDIAPDAKVTSKKAVPVYLNYSAVDGNGGGEVIPRDTYDFPVGGIELGDSGFIWICIYEIDGNSYVIS